MHLTLHLTFAGQCETAFNFYEASLGGQILTLVTYGDSPMANLVSLEWRQKLIHATMRVGDSVFVGADVVAEHYQPPQGFFVLLTIEEVEKAERAFRALADNGTVLMAPKETFWSPYYGVLIDRFGIPWEISSDQKKNGPAAPT